jgi:hypothetical protein
MRAVEFMAFTRACASRTHSMIIGFSIETIQKTQLLISYVNIYIAQPLIATGYGLDNQGFQAQVPVGSRFSSSPRPPDR